MICCVLLLGLGARARAGLLGDLNGDGRVDGADLKLFVQQLRLSKAAMRGTPTPTSTATAPSTGPMPR